MDNDFDSAQPPTSNPKQETQNNRLWTTASTPLSRQHQTLNKKQQTTDYGQRLPGRSAEDIKYQIFISLPYSFFPTAIHCLSPIPNAR